jgi:RimJ/RimL family protein N-acetyltransferase
LLVLSVGQRWTRPTLRYVAGWLFDDLDLRRVTARVRSDDRATRDYVRRLGFRHEGVQRRWFADDVDAVLWGLLRTERKPWL